MSFTKTQLEELKKQGSTFEPIYALDTKTRGVVLEDFAPVVTKTKFGDWHRVKFSLEETGELTLPTRNRKPVDVDGPAPMLRRFTAKITEPFKCTNGTMIQPGQVAWFVVQ